jgi:hypothetical protein
MSDLKQVIFLHHGAVVTAEKSYAIVDLSINLDGSCTADEALEYLRKVYWVLFIDGKKAVRSPVSSLPATGFGRHPLLTPICVERGAKMKVEFGVIEGGELENGGSLDRLQLVLGVEEVK